ncbi:MAG TPA: heme-binding domain-containing protein [Candidatus Baltobacteraceae bacterium]|nr:heme-binding domain-containing protein [Candidatus Baltobacteraceae bacterium]
MKRIIKWIFIALVAVFVVAQFFNPPRSNPPVKNDFIAATKPPPEIAAMFRASCYDCHSHETTWPWYSRIAPISWTVAQDVDYGRGNLNLSDWPTNDLTRAAKKMEIMSEDIQEGDMPMKKYTLIHRDARLTENQRKQLADWLDAEAEKLRANETAL